MPWRSTGLADDPAATSIRAVHVAGRPVAIVRWAGGWHAVEDRCSHAGCAFSEDGTVEDGRLVCDCHGSEFDLVSGRAVVGPATDPVAILAIRSIDGRIEVEA